MSDVIICEYLAYSEAKTLINRLKAISVDAYFIGTNNGEYVSISFSIFVAEKNIEAAMPIVNAYQKEVKLNSTNKKMICPNCKSIPSDTYHKKELSF